MPGSRLPSFTDSFASEETRTRLKHLVAPHVDSYNYFIDHGLEESIADMMPMEMKISEEVEDDNSSAAGSKGEAKKGRGIYLRMTITNAHVAWPMRKDETNGKLTPREARERGLSYAGSMACSVNIQVYSRAEEGNADITTLGDINITARLGDLPVMVMSSRCHLRGLSAKDLVHKFKEEGNEMGGYFIMSGIERVIRLLQVPRRNYVMAIERKAYKNRGPQYSNLGVTMRCVRPDQSSVTVTLHYLINGGATLRFVLRKQEFLLPVILVAKALVEITDKELYDRIMQYDSDNTFIGTRIELLLRDAKQYGLNTAADCRAYLGTHFRVFLPIADDTSDVDAGLLLIQRFFFVHTASLHQKLDCLIHCMRKLFSFAQGQCAADNADALMNHEILLPGHLMNMYVKEKMEELLLAVRQGVMKDMRYGVSGGSAAANMAASKAKFMRDCLLSAKYYQRQFDRNGSSIGGKIGTFLSTGNVVSSTGLDLMQVSGYTIIGEKLNMFRYMSHFQSVHRGQFFTTMKTTAVRKLLPESWGFLCPVHTPDGGPCGLLNHLAKDAIIVCYPTTDRLPTTPTGILQGNNDQDHASGDTGGKYWVSDQRELIQLMCGYGMVPASTSNQDGRAILSTQHYIPVLYDGIVFGGLHHSNAAEFVAQMRALKLVGGSSGRLDPTLEIAYVPHKTTVGNAFAGVFMFSSPGRMIRPVVNLQLSAAAATTPSGSRGGLVEYIGPLEQVFMDIACLSDDIRAGETTHIERHPTVMLSQVASFTPYSDYNQSPRNMYQCQMGKQTMGTPAHALKHRGGDNKLYRIQNVQSPIVQNETYKQFQMDEYAQGVNAVVAVIAYTGYDMEDAMIISRGSYDRGFGHGSMYKTIIVDLAEEEKKTMGGGASKPALRFSNIERPGAPKGRQLFGANGGEVDDGATGDGPAKLYASLDYDGLPMEGDIVHYGEPLCCFQDDISGEHRVVKHKDTERVVIDTVRIIGSNSSVGSGSGGSSEKSGRPSLGAGSPGGAALGSGSAGGSLKKVSITLRYNRNPVIGDKFSSRHGQKGTLSVLWPQESMPFTESGMAPDILINPHAFPSRMTIGMLVESMAGKSGAMHGMFQDGTPFNFHEKNRVIDHMGEQLRSAGYHYHGSEPLYNGLTGNVMQADIFIGVVYYQRLRHMVSDKSQARSTGPVMAITRQPVKGRKKHGGIRLGEMERDALLSHGVAFCVHDRLMNSSDAHNAHVCNSCGGLITVHALPRDAAVRGAMTGGKIAPGFQRTGPQMYCSVCKSGDHIHPVHLPYVYRYLTNELAGMGIKLALKLTE